MFPGWLHKTKMSLPSRRSGRSIHSHDDQALTQRGLYGYSYLNYHPDERKPTIPYQIGSKLHAVAYEPPKGNPHDWSRAAVGQLKDDLQNLPPLQACLKHPPAKGTPGTSSVQLRIIDHVRVGDLKNSQVLKAMVCGRDVRGGAPAAPTSPPTSAIVAAKIYDPLYADFDDCQPDPFYNSDAAFALETEAYRDYLQPLTGKTVPHYFGSYSIDVPISEDSPRDAPGPSTGDHQSPATATGHGSRCRTRPVRAILYEYVPGIALREGMEDRLYNQTQRKEIMRALVTAESLLRQLDVLIEQDFAPRNVLVKSAEEGKPADIRIIDFGAAICGERRDEEGHAPTTEPEPMSQIIERWRNLDDDQFDIPSNIRYEFEELVDWDWDDWLRKDYAYNRG